MKKVVHTFCIVGVLGLASLAAGSVIHHKLQAFGDQQARADSLDDHMVPLSNGTLIVIDDQGEPTTVKISKTARAYWIEQKR